jgi:hypothetical protein
MLLDKIRKRPGERWHIAELARLAAMSKRTFMRRVTCWKTPRFPSIRSRSAAASGRRPRCGITFARKSG